MFWVSRSGRIFLGLLVPFSKEGGTDPGIIGAGQWDEGPWFVVMRGQLDEARTAQVVSARQRFAGKGTHSKKGKCWSCRSDLEKS